MFALLICQLPIAIAIAIANKEQLRLLRVPMFVIIIIDNQKHRRLLLLSAYAKCMYFEMHPHNTLKIAVLPPSHTVTVTISKLEKNHALLLCSIRCNFSSV